MAIDSGSIKNTAVDSLGSSAGYQADGPQVDPVQAQNFLQRLYSNGLDRLKSAGMLLADGGKPQAGLAIQPPPDDSVLNAIAEVEEKYAIKPLSPYEKEILSYAVVNRFINKNIVASSAKSDVLVGKALGAVAKKFSIDGGAKKLPGFMIEKLAEVDKAVLPFSDTEISLYKLVNSQGKRWTSDELLSTAAALIDSGGVEQDAMKALKVDKKIFGKRMASIYNMFSLEKRTPAGLMRYLQESVNVEIKFSKPAESTPLAKALTELALKVGGESIPERALFVASALIKSGGGKGEASLRLDLTDQEMQAEIKAVADVFKLENKTSAGVMHFFESNLPADLMKPVSRDQYQSERLVIALNQIGLDAGVRLTELQQNLLVHWIMKRFGFNKMDFKDINEANKFSSTLSHVANKFTGLGKSEGLMDFLIEQLVQVDRTALPFSDLELSILDLAKENGKRIRSGVQLEIAVQMLKTRDVDAVKFELGIEDAQQFNGYMNKLYANLGVPLEQRNYEGFLNYLRENTDENFPVNDGIPPENISPLELKLWGQLVKRGEAKIRYSSIEQNLLKTIVAFLQFDKLVEVAEELDLSESALRDRIKRIFEVYGLKGEPNKKNLIEQLRKVIPKILQQEIANEVPVTKPHDMSSREFELWGLLVGKNSYDPALRPENQRELLKVADALLQEKSFTGAGRVLGLSLDSVKSKLATIFRRFALPGPATTANLIAVLEGRSSGDKGLKQVLLQFLAEHNVIAIDTQMKVLVTWVNKHFDQNDTYPVIKRELSVSNGQDVTRNALRQLSARLLGYESVAELQNFIFDNLKNKKVLPYTDLELAILDLAISKGHRINEWQQLETVAGLVKAGGLARACELLGVEVEVFSSRISRVYDKFDLPDTIRTAEGLLNYLSYSLPKHVVPDASMPPFAEQVLWDAVSGVQGKALLVKKELLSTAVSLIQTRSGVATADALKIDRKTVTERLRRIFDQFSLSGPKTIRNFLTQMDAMLSPEQLDKIAPERAIQRIAKKEGFSDAEYEFWKKLAGEQLYSSNLKPNKEMLSIVLSVMEAGSYKAAAEKLGLKAPIVSAKIKEIFNGFVLPGEPSAENLRQILSQRITNTLFQKLFPHIGNQPEGITDQQYGLWLALVGERKHNPAFAPDGQLLSKVASLIDARSFGDIANTWGVSDEAVMYWLQKTHDKFELPGKAGFENLIQFLRQRIPEASYKKMFPDAGSQPEGVTDQQYKVWLELVGEHKHNPFLAPDPDLLSVAVALIEAKSIQRAADSLGVSSGLVNRKLQGIFDKFGLPGEVSGSNFLSIVTTGAPLPQGLSDDAPDDEKPNEKDLVEQVVEPIAGIPQIIIRPDNHQMADFRWHLGSLEDSSRGASLGIETLNAYLERARWQFGFELKQLPLRFMIKKTTEENTKLLVVVDRAYGTKSLHDRLKSDLQKTAATDFSKRLAVIPEGNATRLVDKQKAIERFRQTKGDDRANILIVSTAAVRPAGNENGVSVSADTIIDPEHLADEYQIVFFDELIRYQGAAKILLESFAAIDVNQAGGEKGRPVTVQQLVVDLPGMSQGEETGAQSETSQKADQPASNNTQAASGNSGDPITDSLSFESSPFTVTENEELSEQIAQQWNTDGESTVPTTFGDTESQHGYTRIDLLGQSNKKKPGFGALGGPQIDIGQLIKPAESPPVPGELMPGVEPPTEKPLTDQQSPQPMINTPGEAPLGVPLITQPENTPGHTQPSASPLETDAKPFGIESPEPPKVSPEIQHTGRINEQIEVAQTRAYQRLPDAVKAQITLTEYQSLDMTKIDPQVLAADINGYLQLHPKVKTDDDGQPRFRMIDYLNYDPGIQDQLRLNSARFGAHDAKIQSLQQIAQINAQLANELKGITAQTKQTTAAIQRDTARKQQQSRVSIEQIDLNQNRQQSLRTIANTIPRQSISHPGQSGGDVGSTITTIKNNIVNKPSISGTVSAGTRLSTEIVPPGYISLNGLTGPALSDPNYRGANSLPPYVYAKGQNGELALHVVLTQKNAIRLQPISTELIPVKAGTAETIYNGGWQSVPQLDYAQQQLLNTMHGTPIKAAPLQVPIKSNVNNPQLPNPIPALNPASGSAPAPVKVPAVPVP